MSTNKKMKNNINYGKVIMYFVVIWTMFFSYKVAKNVIFNSTKGGSYIIERTCEHTEYDETGGYCDEWGEPTHTLIKDAIIKYMITSSLYAGLLVLLIPLAKSDFFKNSKT